jgi:hypothetical protein
VTLNSSRPRWWHEYLCLATPSAGSEDIRREISPRNRSLCRFVNYAALATPIPSNLELSTRDIGIIMRDDHSESPPESILKEMPVKFQLTNVSFDSALKVGPIGEWKNQRPT